MITEPARSTRPNPELLFDDIRLEPAFAGRPAAAEAQFFAADSGPTCAGSTTPCRVAVGAVVARGEADHEVWMVPDEVGSSQASHFLAQSCLRIAVKQKTPTAPAWMLP
jgi:hypothetical protein